MTQTRPAVSLIVTPRFDGDLELLREALSVLVHQYPDIRIGDEASGHFIISAANELGLEALRQHILREGRVQVDIGPPRAIYLETIRNQAVADGACIYQGGTQNRMYAKVKLRLEPVGEGDGYQFKEEIPAGMIPPEFVNAVNLSIQDAMKSGILAGQEIVDLRAVLCDGAYHPEESSELAFRIAASIAFKKAVRKADPVVLEPIMAVEVRGPEEHLIISSIIGDLKRRRGEITGLEHQENLLILRAIVPMPEMMGYGSFLRSNSRGYGEHATRLIRFTEALPNGSSDDNDGGLPVEPNDPKPDPGVDQTGVPVLKPRDPKPMSRSAAAKLDSESE